MKTLLIICTFLGLSIQSNWACTCIGQDTFCESIVYEDGEIHESVIVLRGKHVGKNNLGIKFKVLEILHGNLPSDLITIRNGNGADCSQSTDGYSNGDEMILAIYLYYGDEENVYDHTICGVSMLSVQNGKVKGAVAPGITEIPLSDFYDLSNCGNLQGKLSGVNVYPTLTDGLVYVSSDFNGEATVNWTLFDVTGRRIETGQILVNQESETEINFSKLANGLYFIRFTEGILEKTIRIVISQT